MTDWLYVVKTDSSNKGKTVNVELSLEEALDIVRGLVGEGLVVQLERIERPMNIDGFSV